MSFIKPNDAPITSNYGRRIHPISGHSKMHWGIDYGRNGSDNIVASADGTVTLARMNAGFGNCIYIVHNIGGKVYETVYAHLSRINVRVGQVVKQGQIIGIKGTTGNSTGVHLHFELCVGRWNNKYTTNVNPAHYITDEAVKSVQELLILVGYKVQADGIAGPATNGAVREFQTKVGITVDGIAGSVTIKKLKEAIAILNAKPVAKPVATTRYSDVSITHTAYKALERLSESGIINGHTDGTYKPNDPVTRAQLAIVVDRLIESLKG